MDAAEFRRAGKEMIDLVADYLENIRDRRPLSAVEPGYLAPLIPAQAPQDPESWEDVKADIERVIMPGVTHWHHPNFHAYFPTANSYSAITADILSDAIGCIGFSWVASPACTELEVVMMDWLAQMIQLPQQFMSGGKGGGVIMGTASEATLVGLLAARSRMLSKIKENKPDIDEDTLLSKFVCYCSDQAHSSVERSALLGAVKCHKVESDSLEQMRGDALQKAIEEDKRQGLIPFYVVATLGCTPACSFDKLLEIGPVCSSADVWMHVDAAYAGSSFICPEYRPLLDGIEYADSYNFNPHKWLLVQFDCSAMWFKDTTHVVDAFNVDPLYLKHQHQGKVPDYRHWQIPLGRRFRSLKLWFVMRLHGVKGLQEHIRKQIKLAHDFEGMLKTDSRFEVTHEVTMGLVCFRLKGYDNDVNEKLLKCLNDDGRIHLVPSSSKGIYFLRFAVCAASTNIDDIKKSWATIQELSSKIIEQHK